MEELKIGDVIKQRYSLVQFLGSGSFGEVWLAHDQMTGRDVALKIYLSLDPAGVEEFQREYANTADLSSPYLLTPEYFDAHNRRPFLVMKYCENGSPSKLAGQISEDKIWSFIHDVASGLDVLHSQSDPIIHQDIKPDNILIDSNGRFLITDFGISKRLRATMRRQSKRDVSSGAMPYMAPERFDSSPRLTTASDIWSLGASIYELATGELPFSGFGGAMQRNGAGMPIISGYSKQLNTLMQECLNPDYINRPSADKIKQWASKKTVKKTLNGQPTVKKVVESPHNETVSVPGRTVADKTEKKGSSSWIWIILGIVILGAIGFFASKDRTTNGVDESITQSSVEEIAPVTITQRIISSPSSNIGVSICHFYTGAFYYGNDIYPVMVAFIQNGDLISSAIYKNVTYGGRIKMSYQSTENSLTLSGKDGSNNFTLELSPSEDDRLTGTAIDGNKTMTVRLMPTTETFDISNIGEQRSEYPYDIATIAKAFISKYQGGAAPWSCLNSTSAKRLSNNLEDDPSSGGIYMVPFSAPLTVNGKPLVKNQLDEAEVWDIYLRGPNAGAMSLMFSAMPQYVNLEDVARKIGQALGASYQSKRQSDYGNDCVLFYSLGNMKLAIYCSFGAHGGTIEALLGNPDSVNQYANSCI